MSFGQLLLFYLTAVRRGIIGPMPSAFNPYKPSLREWGGGLVWGGLLLLFALMFACLFVGDVRDARIDSPTLSPATQAQLELSEYYSQLVDVEGFELDCELAAFDGEQLLAPAFNPAGGLIFVTFEHSSDCRQAASSFRANATLMKPGLRAELGFDGPEFEAATIVIVEPHDVGYWMIPALLVFAGLGVFGINTALSTRRQLLRELNSDLSGAESAPAPAEDDNHDATDPYRPGVSGRLITEKVALASAYSARLRRARMLQAGLAVVLLGSLAFASAHNADS